MGKIILKDQPGFFSVFHRGSDICITEILPMDVSSLVIVLWMAGLS